MSKNRYSMLLPLRIAAIILSVYVIVCCAVKGAAYDIVLRSEFSFFRCTPDSLIQNIMLKGMLIIVFAIVAVFYVFSHIFTLPIVKGQDNSAGFVMELAADLLAALTGVLYIICVRSLAKCTAYPGAIDYKIFIGIIIFFGVNFIVKFILNKKISKCYSHSSVRGERNALLCGVGTLFIAACFIAISLFYSGTSKSIFGLYNKEFGKNAKELEDTMSNSFSGAVAMGDAIYFTDTVQKPFDPAVYKIYKSGAEKLVDGSHYITNDGFLCSNGTDIYYLSKNFKDFASKTFLVVLDTENDETRDIKFENVPTGYLVCDEFLAIRDGQLYFALLLGGNDIEIHRIDISKIASSVNVSESELYAGNMIFVNNSKDLYEAVIHNSGMPDGSISYKGGRLYTLKDEFSPSISLLPEEMKKVITTFKSHHFSDFYVSKSDSAYRREYQASLANGEKVNKYTSQAKLISGNVDIFNIYKDHIYFSAVTGNGCEIYKCDLDGSNLTLLKKYEDHILCARIYVSDSFIACYCKNDEHYLINDSTHSGDQKVKIEVLPN